MVYLLHAYFGREGREEAEELLHRNSGSDDAPRILGAFNEETPDWLSFFMFTYFTDRDGKYQLGTLKESAFDPLSRTCEFMLKEEAHHMMVGTTGIDRVVERTAQADASSTTPTTPTRSPARGVDPARRDPEVPELPLLGRRSTSSAARRPPTSRTTTPPGSRAAGSRTAARTTTGSPTTRSTSTRWSTARSASTEVSALVGLNTDLRREYIADCQGGVKRWNKILDEAGLDAAARAAARRLQPQGRRVRRHRGHARTAGSSRADEWAAGQGELPADRRRQDARPFADAPGLRARQDRVVDRAAAERHQRPAVRLRLRPPALSPTAPTSVASRG